MPTPELAPIKSRRSFTATFKADIVAACAQPKTSIAAVARTHGLNANLVHKWIRLAGATAPATIPPFVPLVAPALTLAGQHIDIHLRRGTTEVTVHWPLSQAASCTAWLQAWLG